MTTLAAPFTPPRHTSSFLRALAVCTSLCLSALAFAADAPKQSFNLPADSAEKSLRSFSQQSGLEVIFPTGVVQGVRTNPVSGEMSARDALDAMLADTGLVVIQDRSTGAFSVRKETPAESKNGSRAVVATDVRPDSGSPRYETDEQGNKVLKLDTFEVVGRKTLNMDIPRTVNDPQPYVILTSEQITNSSAVDLDDFLKSHLPMNATFGSNIQAPRSITGSNSSVNLRGLGTNETLVLVDGRRIAGVNFNSSTNGQPDLNGIPLSAIDHIEILPTSASAIYGGEALGGVINVILKRKYHGGAVNYTYDTPLDVDAPLRILEATYGFSLFGGRTRVMLSGRYSDGKPLLVGDRKEMIESNIRTILRNSPSFLHSPTNPFQGATTNITSNSSSIPLTLDDGTALNSPITHISPGAAPNSDLTQGLLANAGQYNLDLSNGTGLYGLRNTITRSPRVKSLFATVRHEFSPKLELFGKFSYEQNKSLAENNPFIAIYTVPISSPINPFRQQVRVSIPMNASVLSETNSITRSAGIGAIAKLGKTWSMEADYTWSENVFNLALPTNDTTSVNAALASGALNPFVDTIQYPLNMDPYLSVQTIEGVSSVNDAVLRFSGTAFELPAGRAQIASGVGYREEATDNVRNTRVFNTNPARNQEQIVFGRGRTTMSGYAELNIPVVASAMQIPFIYSVDVQLAGRVDRFAVETGTAYEYLSPANLVATNPPQGISQVVKYTAKNPTIGVKYKPQSALTFRASFARAFLTPTPAQLLKRDTLSAVFTSPLFDPQTGTSYSGYRTLNGGNPDLAPQTSESWSYGGIWAPESGLLQGLRLSIDYYQITQPDYITTPTPQQVVSTVGLESRVVRDPTTGLITVVDVTFLNALKYKTSGYDLSLGYRKSSSIGVLELRALGTWVKEDKRQYTIGSPDVDYVRYPIEGGQPQFKASATFSWSRGPWMVAWTANHFSAYKQQFSPGSPLDIQFGLDGTLTAYVDAQGGTSVPEQSYHDLLVSWDHDKSRSTKERRKAKLLSGVVLQVGIRNLLNQAPPFDASGAPYYYSYYGDPRLRTIRASFKKSF